MKFLYRKKASVTEYGLFIGLIAVLLLLSVEQVGTQLKTLFGFVNTQLTLNNVVADTGDAVPAPEEEDPYTLQQFVVEIQGHHDGNAAVIRELRFYDTDTTTPLTYTTPSVYDSVTSNNPTYWSSSCCWNYTNLQDGETSYTSNSNGGGTSTLFLYNSTPTSTAFARFTGTFSSEVSIGRIYLYAGSVTDQRTPYAIRIYKIDPDDFDADIHLKTQTTNNLTLITEETYSSSTDEKVTNATPATD